MTREEAQKYLEELGYVPGKSNTSTFPFCVEPGRTKIKAACLVLATPAEPIEPPRPAAG